MYEGVIMMEIDNATRLKILSMYLSNYITGLWNIIDNDSKEYNIHYWELVSQLVGESLE